MEESMRAMELAAQAEASAVRSLFLAKLAVALSVLSLALMAAGRWLNRR